MQPMVDRERLFYEIGGVVTIISLGSLYVVSAAWLAYIEIVAGTSLIDATMFSMFVGAPGLLLVYGGYRLRSMSIDPRHYHVISTWCLSAIVILTVLLSLYHVLPPGRIVNYSRALLVINAFVTIPAFIGGINAARARTRSVELERALDLLQHTERTANVGGWEIDVSTQDLYWSDQLTEILRWEHEEPPLDEALDLYHPDDRPIVEAAIRDALDEGEPIDVEARVQPSTGGERWLRIIGTPELVNGAVVSLRGAAQDITERKERELELQKHEELTEAANDVIVSIDEHSTIQNINPKVEEVFGYSQGELIGESLTILMPDGLAEQHRSGVERYLETGERSLDWEGTQLTGIHANGSEIPLSVSFSEVEYEGNLYFSGILRDITQRKERERELQRIRDRMEFALTSTESIVWDWNVNEDRVTFHPSAEPLYGTTVENWNDFISLVHPDDRAQVEAGIEQALETGEPKSEEIRIIRDGEIRWIDAPGELVEDEDGTTRMVGVVRDITERKTYEQQLEESNKRLEQFAYAASHDLQEPLRMVSSYLQLIERRYEDDLDEVGQEFLGYAVDGANRMRAMVQGLLKYSRVDTEGTSMEPVDLNEVIANVREDLAIPIAERDADIAVNELPEVFGDEHQLRQVFQNLFHNAIQYSGDEPPRVQVSAERNGAFCTVSVADNGIGIDPNEHDRIFELFERLHSQDGPGGSGIGLALCERIIERHGGEIWVESDDGDGSTFRLTIPMEEGFHGV